MTAKRGNPPQAGRRQLRLGVVMRLSECAIRFLLAAALAGTEIFGGHALFALLWWEWQAPDWRGLPPCWARRWVTCPSRDFWKGCGTSRRP